MYIWVILAVFMVTLASFHVPVRNDMADFTEVPRADAPIVHFIKQHEAARDFVRNNFCRRTAEHETGVENEPEDALRRLEREDEYPDAAKALAAGTFGTVNFANFIAVHNGQLAGSYVYTPEIQQTLECFNDTQRINCLNANQGYIVSFMRISDEWLENISTVTDSTGAGEARKVPNIYFRRALMSRTGSRNLGYTQPCVENDDCSYSMVESDWKITSIGSGRGEVPIQKTDDFDVSPASLGWEKGGTCDEFPCLVLFDQVTLFGDCPRPQVTETPVLCDVTPDGCTDGCILDNGQCVPAGGPCENGFCPGDQECVYLENDPIGTCR